MVFPAASWPVPIPLRPHSVHTYIHTSGEPQLTAPRRKYSDRHKPPTRRGNASETDETSSHLDSTEREAASDKIHFNPLRYRGVFRHLRVTLVEERANSTQLRENYKQLRKPRLAPAAFSLLHYFLHKFRLVLMESTAPPTHPPYVLVCVVCSLECWFTLHMGCSFLFAMGFLACILYPEGKRQEHLTTCNMQFTVDQYLSLLAGARTFVYPFVLS